jgi:sucrose synthase
MVAAYLQEHCSDGHRVLHHFGSLERNLFLRSDLIDGFRFLCESKDGRCLENTPLARVIQQSQEGAMDQSWFYLALRRRIGRWMYVRIHRESIDVEGVGVSDYLAFKERLVGGEPDEWMLEVDLEPFSREFQKPQEAKSIGRGVEFLNRRLSSRLFEGMGKGEERLFEFLRVHSYRGQQLMLNGAVQSLVGLRRALREAAEYAEEQAPDTP